MSKVARALISVSDKTGITEFSRRLRDLSIELISTGGTANALREAGLQVRDVSELTGFPEILSGRVKTLHPKVHGGILAVRSDSNHQKQVDDNGIQYVDMVVVNLYPFAETIARSDVTAAEAIENIDIGGPSMIRSAAKNFNDVAVVVDPADYAAVARELAENGNALSLETRLKLARKAFEATSNYDTTISGFLAGSVEIKDRKPVVHKETGLPARFSYIAPKTMSLRYGENPHQRAALYVRDPRERGVATAEKIQGKELSYNNFIDLDAAWNLVGDMRGCACAIIKHTNPCGAATGSDVVEAFEKARATDPVSAYGGIIGFNRTVTEAAARAIAETFFEAIAAPDYDPEALAIFTSKKNLRVMRMGDHTDRSPFDLRMISGGLLVQERDNVLLDEALMRVVSARTPSETEMRALHFAWVISKHVKSNAIVYAREDQLVGVGAGQMSRVDSVKIGAMKANLPLNGTVVASDAFFPFRDGVDEAAAVGVTAVIQPGGSMRDPEVIAAANEHNLAMVFTEIRHFKH
ncbi:MAG: bifunctional phosphoribosylaminoimidazolecarboxamide formyltransferase/inosine monophosphate cyclohydrolase [Blastocatellia bacterium AA13]|nr:MAG: bifunctional phosphoribosylaminoimidazolecarboxamide formyltransferase/inosine monophosphate cyclohydrolase [Blastocatellia bacterium AA13]